MSGIVHNISIRKIKEGVRPYMPHRTAPCRVNRSSVLVKVLKRERSYGEDLTEVRCEHAVDHGFDERVVRKFVRGKKATGQDLGATNLLLYYRINIKRSRSERKAHTSVFGAMKVSKKSLYESMVKNVTFPPTDLNAVMRAAADFFASLAFKRGLAQTALEADGLEDKKVSSHLCG